MISPPSPPKKIKAGAHRLLQYYSKSYYSLSGILYLLLVVILQPRMLKLGEQLHRAACVLHGVVDALPVARLRAYIYARDKYFKQLHVVLALWLIAEIHEELECRHILLRCAVNECERYIQVGTLLHIHLLGVVLHEVDVLRAEVDSGTPVPLLAEVLERLDTVRELVFVAELLVLEHIKVELGTAEVAYPVEEAHGLDYILRERLLTVIDEGVGIVVGEILGIAELTEISVELHISLRIFISSRAERLCEHALFTFTFLW